MSATARAIAAGLLGLIAAAPAAAGVAAEPPPGRFEFREPHMGSEFTILMYSADPAAARRASRAAFDRIAALDSALSDYDPQSELMRLCAHAGGPPVPASADLFRVLDRSREFWARSGGAFDPTIAPVGRLWRRARRDGKLPEPETLARARLLVGFDHVRLDPTARTVQLLKAGMKLDLGGIAKGFAAGEAIATLKHAGIDRALVAGSGDVVVSGPPPGRAGWTIGIAPLKTPRARPARYLLLHDVAISTAGDTEKFVEIAGTRYSHIVDPKTGLGLTGLAAVTVIAPDGATADALDTAARLLGPAAGRKLIDETPGAAGLILVADGDGERAFESRRFRDLPAAPPGPGDAGTGP